MKDDLPNEPPPEKGPRGRGVDKEYVLHRTMVKLTRKEIEEAVKDPKWQTFRESLKGTPTKLKLVQLRIWLRNNHNSKESRIQVQNYLNALRRAGDNVPNITELDK